MQEASLSAEEMIAIEARLNEMGVDMTEVGFAGRLIVFGDAYAYADELLASASTGDVEKGRTFATTSTAANIDGLPLAPTLFSQIFNNNYQFMRPDIQGIRIVIPNGAAASFLVGLFQTAAANVVNAASDCLTGISVITQATYDAMDPNDKIFVKPIFVRFGSSVCPGAGASTNACALFPRNETREFDINLSTTRLVPGTRIGVLSTRINTTVSNGQTCTSGQATCNTNNAAILTHELLHTLGLAHPSDPNAVRVVGTLGGSLTTSIMQGFCTPGPGCIFPATPSADDVDTIDTLFSQQSTALYPGGDTCGWRGGVKTLAAN
jgi:hypothetical protein